MRANDIELMALSRKLDLYISAVVLLCIEEALIEDGQVIFTVGSGLYLRDHIADKYMFQFYEARTVLSNFWDVRGAFSNMLCKDISHPLRFHFTRVEPTSSRLLRLTNASDVECHSYFKDEAGRVRPLSFRDSAYAPSIHELGVILEVIEKHAIGLGCSSI